VRLHSPLLSKSGSTDEKTDSSTAQALQAESGFALEDSAVGQFRQAVLGGQWDDVERLLGVLPIPSGGEMTVRLSSFLLHSSGTDATGQ
jgi:hypothetical protein